MSWTDWACLGVFILGFLLFLYGANIYNAAVGFTGLSLLTASVVAYILLYVYRELTKKPVAQ